MDNSMKWAIIEASLLIPNSDVTLVVYEQYKVTLPVSINKAASIITQFNISINYHPVHVNTELSLLNYAMYYYSHTIKIPAFNSHA